ncbi:MAG: RNA-binding protein [Nitrospirae bacterium]|nr:MAG: RNA-binding protein [Nitrospirota bacterium]
MTESDLCELFEQVSTVESVKVFRHPDGQCIGLEE